MEPDETEGEPGEHLMPKAIQATETERRSEAILHAVARAHGARRDAKPGQVLIGGTALRLAHDLPRPSTDLDFVHRTNEEDRGETEVPEILEALGFKVITQTPDTRVPIRTNIEIRKSGWRNLWGERTTIIVDDIRSLDIEETDVTKRNGIWTTNIKRLLELKLDSIEDLSGEEGKRIAGRDLYDVGFILEKHGETFTVSQILHLSAIMDNSVYGAAQEDWGRAFADDRIMKRASLVEVGDEIERRVGAFKAEFEQLTGTKWDVTDLKKIGDRSMRELKWANRQYRAITGKTGGSPTTNKSGVENDAGRIGTGGQRKRKWKTPKGHGE